MKVRLRTFLVRNAKEFSLHFTAFGCDEVFKSISPFFLPSIRSSRAGRRPACASKLHDSGLPQPVVGRLKVASMD
jgi:hypothetical protein